LPNVKRADGRDEAVLLEDREKIAEIAVVYMTCQLSGITSLVEILGGTDFGLLV